MVLFLGTLIIPLAMSNKNNKLSTSSVRDAMEQVLSSNEFHDSSRLQGILRYVVEETLAGRSTGIKETTIAMDVFERNINDDAEPSSIVRVSVARLRRKLSHYYTYTGRNDLIRIEIGNGSYVPTFELKGDSEEGELPAKGAPTEENNAAIEAPGGISSSGWLRWLGLALGIAAIAIIVWNLMPHRDTAPEVTTKPFVVVLPLVNASGGELDSMSTAGYLDAIVTDLTKLSGLSVMATNSAVYAANESLSLQTLRAEQGVSHILRGTLSSQSEILRVSVQLIDTATEQAIWAERFEGNLYDWFGLQDTLANRIATALSVTLNPDESRRVYLRHTSNREAMELLRHATVSINPPNERGRIEASRSLNERVIDLDPRFAGGYAGLSQVHSYMVLFEHSNKPEDELKNAIGYAQKAIEMDDGFGLGHSMLGLAYSLQGKTDLALAQVRRAVALEPGDPLSYQWLSGVLIFSGRPTEAIPAVHEALRLDPIEPGTPYLNILGMAHFNGGQYELALDAFEQNRQRGGPNAPNMEAYRAATYAMLGREVEAREIIANLRVRPGEITPENWIRRWTPSQKKAEQAINSLHRLGLKPSAALENATE